MDWSTHRPHHTLLSGLLHELVRAVRELVWDRLNCITDTWAPFHRVPLVIAMDSLNIWQANKRQSKYGVAHVQIMQGTQRVMIDEIRNEHHRMISDRGSSTCIFNMKHSHTHLRRIFHFYDEDIISDISELASAHIIHDHVIESMLLRNFCTCLKVYTPLWSMCAAGSMWPRLSRCLLP